MWNKILAVCAVVIAVILALLALMLPVDRLNGVIAVSHFIEVLLLVLAIGALLLYLTHCPKFPAWDVILSASTIVVGIVLGLLSVCLPESKAGAVMAYMQFLETVLPVLGTAALLKFLTNVKGAK